MRVVDDAFVYRLTWAVEAVRMYRRSQGGESEANVEGAAAACLETGLPFATMAMLVRAGLPSRAAAKAAIEQVRPVFTNRAQMKAWLHSDAMIVLDANPEWPTLETHAIWQRFRQEVLTDLDETWSEQQWTMTLAEGRAPLPSFPMRIDLDPVNGAASVATPDFKPLIQIRQRMAEESPSLFEVESVLGKATAVIRRIGRGEARWVEPG